MNTSALAPVGDRHCDESGSGMTPNPLPVMRSRRCPGSQGAIGNIEAKGPVAGIEGGARRGKLPEKQAHSLISVWSQAARLHPLQLKSLSACPLTSEHQAVAGSFYLRCSSLSMKRCLYNNKWRKIFLLLMIDVKKTELAMIS